MGSCCCEPEKQKNFSSFSCDSLPQIKKDEMFYKNYDSTRIIPQQERDEEVLFVNQRDYQDDFDMLESRQAKMFPYDCIGLLAYKKHQKKIIGTAFLIASDLVLTVAHNIYCREKEQDFTDFTFYPGVSKQSYSKKGYRVVSYRISDQYRKKESLQYDYALLKLEREITKPKYIELGINYIQREQTVGILSYRGSTTNSGQTIQFQLWKANAHESDLLNFSIKHQLSSFPGNSGAPLLVIRENKYVVIGIHKGEYTKIDANVARIITDDFLLNLMIWEKQMAPSFLYHTTEIKFHHMLDSDGAFDSAYTTLIDQFY